MNFKAYLLVLSFALGASSTASAADLQTAPVPSAPVVAPGWIVTLTGTVGAWPEFPGSDKLSLFGYPSFDYRRVGQPRRWTAPDDGFDFPIVEFPNFLVGPVARVSGGRFLESDRQLFGLRKVDWAIEPGLFIEYWPADWLRTRVEIRYGVTGFDGFVGDFAMDLLQRWDQFIFSIGPRVSFGDSNFTDTYFSVTPFEAALNGLVTPFNAKGGVTSAGVLGSVSYVWSEQWTTTVFAGYRRLVGDAGDSPITRRIGSPDQFTVGASLSYSFVFGGF